MRIFLKFNLFLTIVAIILFTGPVSGQTSNGTILGTSDGGDSWSPQVSGTRRYLTGISMLDAKTATAVGEYGTILHTITGGE